MFIEQVMEIPRSYNITLKLPDTVPAGAMARIAITVPVALESEKPEIKSYRGILKGRGITLERLREIQREDKAFEEAAI